MQSQRPKGRKRHSRQRQHQNQRAALMGAVSFPERRPSKKHTPGIYDQYIGEILKCEVTWAVT